MRRFIFLLLASLIFWLPTNDTYADETPPVIVSLDPGDDPVDVISLRVASDSNSTSTTLFLRQPDTAREDVQVRLSAYLVDEAGVRQNQVAIGITARVPVSGTSDSYTTVDAVTSSVPLPGDGSSLPLELRVTNLDETGTFSGTLNLDVDSELVAGPRLRVTHFSEPELQFVGTNEDGFSLKLFTPSFDYPFLIESLNETPTELSVLVNPFFGPDGAPVQATWSIDGQSSGQEVLVEGLGSATVVVSATLPLTGTYTSGLTLIYDGRRHTTKLVVQRTQPMPSVVLSGVETNLTELGCRTLGILPRAWLYGVVGLLDCPQTGDADIWFSLTSTSAQTETLEPPTVTSLALQGSNASESQAQFIRIEAQDMQGRVISPSLVLAPGSTQQLRVAVVGLQGAGEYKGVLQIKGANTQPIVQSITILAREGWWVAVIAIGLGILLSTAIRLLSRVVRPRLATQARLRLALQQIEEAEKELAAQDAKALDPEERLLLESWAREVRAQYDLATWGQAQNSDALISRIQGRLPRFSDTVNLRRRIDALEPPNLREPLRKDLQAVRDALAKAATEAEFEYLDKRLQTLDSNVKKAPDDWLRSQIATLKEQTSTSQPQDTEVTSRMQGIMTELDAASASLDHEQGVEARQHYERARQEYGALLIDDLLFRLETTDTPLGFSSPEKWKTSKDPLVVRLGAAKSKLTSDPEFAIREFQSVYALYLGVLIDYALPVAKRGQQVAKAEQAELFRTVVSDLAEARNAVDTQNLDLASTCYERARDNLKKAKDSPGMMSGTTAALAEALPGGAPAPASIEHPATSIARLTLKLPTVRRLNWSVVLTETILSVAVFVVAVVLGLQLLWVNSLTWGGWGAYVAAFLWGLGLHQVSGQAFVGIGGLREQLTSEPVTKTA